MALFFTLLAEVEPCGLRGCVLYLILEDPDSKSHRKIGCVRPVGSNPVPTFELFLTLKQASSGWLTAVSKKIFKTAGRKTVVISEEYALSKRLLYRTFSWYNCPHEHRHHNTEYNSHYQKFAFRPLQLSCPLLSPLHFICVDDHSASTATAEIVKEHEEGEEEEEEKRKMNFILPLQVFNFGTYRKVHLLQL